jgi:capsule polysaccharide export protein KpsE/RkpR
VLGHALQLQKKPAVLSTLRFLEMQVVNRLSQATLENSGDEHLVQSSDLLDPDVEQESGEADLVPRLRLLWSQRVRLVKATLASFVVAAIITLLIPNKYDANVQLMPPDSTALSGTSAILGLMLGAGGVGGGTGGSSGGGLAGTVGDLLGAQKPGALFIGILGSRTLADRMIDRFDLRKVYSVKTYTAARKKLASRVTFVEDKKSGILKITVEDRDRARVTAMAEAYVEELDALLAHVNTSAASRERAFLEQRLAAVHTELEEATKELSEFSSRNATLDPEDQGKAMLDAAAMLQGQLIAAKSELSGLQQIYTEENVRVRSLQAHISELERQLNTLGGKGYAGSATLDSNSLYPSIRQLPVLGRQYLDLYRRAKVDETVFELLTESYEMAKVQEAKETPSVKVLDAARIPERASWPPRGLLTLGGGFLGFLFASCWIVGLERWSELDPNQPSKLFLSEISRDSRRDLARLRARLSRLMSRDRDLPCQGAE